MKPFGNREKSPNEVFTPRSAEVNEVMYIPRPELENRLTVALNSNLHILIHGESGCGKSWLYKNVLSKLKAHYLPVNLANASNLRSISSALRNSIDRSGEVKKVGYTEKKGGGLSVPGVAKADVEHAAQYELGEKEPFEAALEYCRKSAGSRPAFIVLDNLEAIFAEDELMKELGNCITLLDDDNYSRYDVRMVIVGVPSGVRGYFTKLPNRQTVANRLKEIPEVAALNEAQILDFVKRGFINELRFSIASDEFDSIVEHISWVTMGVPQRLHEYCLELAFLAQGHSKTLSTGLLDATDKNWLEAQLSNDFSVVQSIMNEKETKVGRRNQALYALGQIKRNEFRNSDVEGLIRKEFPESTERVTINVSQILSDLASRSTPIIKRPSSKSDVYTFTDPRFRMCMRAMLRKEPSTGTVYHVEFGRL